MPGRKARTSRLLIFICILLALLCGGLFTKSSALPSPIDELEEPDMFVADDINAAAALTTGEDQITNDSNPEDDIPLEETEPTPTPTVTPIPEPTATPVPLPTEYPVVYEVSPEASSGTWISNENHWMFVINGSAYTGWLNDTDGKRYYLGEDGIMQTGWIEDGGNRYYLDLDGIMQTGDLVIEDVLYHFRADGTLSGTGDGPTATPTVAPTDTPTPVPTDTPVPTPTKKPKKEKTSQNEDSTDSKEHKKEESPNESIADNNTESVSTDSSDTLPVPDKSVALTFDDGPSEYTNDLLNVLEESGIKATFFLQGSHLEGYSETASRMVALGHELGNHGYTHFDFSMLDVTDSSAEVDGVDELLFGYTGVATTLLRPPYGNMNSGLAEITRKPVILWSIDSQDDTLTSAEDIVNTILSSVEDGGIILMHDTSSLTAEAVRMLIPRLAKEGYECMTVSELAAKHGIELLSGVTYSSLKTE